MQRSLALDVQLELDIKLPLNLSKTQQLGIYNFVEYCKSKVSHLYYELQESKARYQQQIDLNQQQKIKIDQLEYYFKGDIQVQYRKQDQFALNEFQELIKQNEDLCYKVNALQLQRDQLLILCQSEKQNVDDLKSQLSQANNRRSQQLLQKSINFGFTNTIYSLDDNPVIAIVKQFQTEMQLIRQKLSTHVVFQTEKVRAHPFLFAQTRKAFKYSQTLLLQSMKQSDLSEIKAQIANLKGQVTHLTTTFGLIMEQSLNFIGSSLALQSPESNQKVSKFDQIEKSVQTDNSKVKLEKQNFGLVVGILQKQCQEMNKSSNSNQILARVLQVKVKMERQKGKFEAIQSKVKMLQQTAKQTQNQLSLVQECQQNLKCFSQERVEAEVQILQPFLRQSPELLSNEKLQFAGQERYEQTAQIQPNPESQFADPPLSVTESEQVDPAPPDMPDLALFPDLSTLENLNSFEDPSKRKLKKKKRGTKSHKDE